MLEELSTDELDLGKDSSASEEEDSSEEDDPSDEEDSKEDSDVEDSTADELEAGLQKDDEDFALFDELDIAILSHKPSTHW